MTSCTFYRLGHPTPPKFFLFSRDFLSPLFPPSGSVLSPTSFLQFSAQFLPPNSFSSQSCFLSPWNCPRSLHTSSPESTPSPRFFSGRACFAWSQNSEMEVLGFRFTRSSRSTRLIVECMTWEKQRELSWGGGEVTVDGRVRTRTREREFEGRWWTELRRGIGEGGGVTVISLTWNGRSC